MSTIKHDEKEMRDRESPRPKSKKELSAVIGALVAGEHDYGTCVYAMSLAAVAAFNFVAHELGVTGFQASCADLDVIRRTRSLEGPFMLLKGEDALYPQYDLVKRLEEALSDWQPWLKEEAEKKLAENPEFVAPAVRMHWEQLAGSRAEAA